MTTPVITIPADERVLSPVTSVCEGPVDAVALDFPGDCGAETVFIGRTRREAHAQFGGLLRLEYEVYEPMASRLMERMARDAAARWPVRAVRLVHSRGAVLPGQASVVVQVATPHRGEGFLACRYLIDRIKHELPIWKHEVWERGRTFVEGCCVHREGDDTMPEAAADHAKSCVHDHQHD